MDITYDIGNGRFNYRVCAVIVSDGRILTIRDGRSPYSYLPGGRVKMGETAETALLRELGEELDIRAEIVRPLWLNQSFFTEDVDGKRFHELCLYFLTDTSATDLAERGTRFTRTEGAKTLTFEWAPYEALADMYFYPTFIKKEIFRLPEAFTLRAEYE